MRRRLPHGGVFWGLCGRRKAAGYLSPPTQPPAPPTIAGRRYGGCPWCGYIDLSAVSHLNAADSATLYLVIIVII